MRARLASVTRTGALPPNSWLTMLGKSASLPSVGAFTSDCAYRLPIWIGVDACKVGVGDQDRGTTAKFLADDVGEIGQLAERGGLHERLCIQASDLDRRRCVQGWRR